MGDRHNFQFYFITMIPNWSQDTGNSDACSPASSGDEQGKMSKLRSPGDSPHKGK